MYDNILIPTDGSEPARRSIRHGVDIAERYGATVHALYVVDLQATNYSLGTEQVERLRQGKLSEMPEVQQKAEEATAEVARQAADAGLEAVEHVAVGSPHDEIVAYIADNDIDLAVMGSHGRSGISRMLLGSVTERVVRTATIPVLVVDARDEEE
ncbi:universal stress protein [Halostella litorea]|uniref:universal stress protein n=1 Tax=Halostella litorea TaxID=2528831 RepID=UPI001092E715|nr:universal stress protein [Halostella litorea]